MHNRYNGLGPTSPRKRGAKSRSDFRVEAFADFRTDNILSDQFVVTLGDSQDGVYRLEPFPGQLLSPSPAAPIF